MNKNKEIISWKLLSELRRRDKRESNYKKGMAPIRRRRKRLHKKLAKRGFAGSPANTIYSSPSSGYGVKGTRRDFLL